MKVWIISVLALFISACVTETGIKTELSFTRGGETYTPEVRSEAARTACLTKTKEQMNQLGYGWLVKRWMGAEPGIRETITEYSGCKYDLPATEFNQLPIMVNRAVMLLGSGGKSMGKLFLSRGTMYFELGKNYEFLSKGRIIPVKIFVETALLENFNTENGSDSALAIPLRDNSQKAEKSIDRDAYSVLEGLNNYLAMLDFHSRQFSNKHTRLVSPTGSTVQQYVCYLDAYLKYFQRTMPKDYKKFIDDASVKGFIGHLVDESEKTVGSANALFFQTEGKSELAKRFDAARGSIRELLSTKRERDTAESDPS